MTDSPESIYHSAGDRLLGYEEVQKFRDKLLWPALEALYPDKNFMDNAMPGEEVSKSRRVPGITGLTHLNFQGMCYLDSDNAAEGEEPPIVCGVLIKIETICPDKMAGLVEALQDSDEAPQVIEAILDDLDAYRPWMIQKYNFTDDEDAGVYVEETYQLRAAEDEDEVYWEPPVFTKNEGRVSGGVYGYYSDELRFSDRMAIESALLNLGLRSGLTAFKEYKIQDRNAVFKIDLNNN